MAKQTVLRTLCMLVYSMNFLRVSFATDTLLGNQTIANGQNLVSRNQLFEMGFFAPGGSRNRTFLGIWYRNTPDVVVWVANRENPVTDPQRALLAIASNGTLVISVPGTVIWLSNSSGVASNPTLQLLDMGNLVLINGTGESSSPGSYIWQSFDYPCNTRLPGMKLVDDANAGVEKYLTSWRSDDDPSPGEFIYKIENNGLPQVVVLRGGNKTFRTGTWYGIYFRVMHYPGLVFDGERLISMRELYNTSSFGRVRIDQTGLVQRYLMNERRDGWNLLDTLQRDQCDNYGQCGPNGICNIEELSKCKCFRGFSPRFQNEWDTQQFDGGCIRNRPLNCVNGDGFLEVRRLKLPDMLQFRSNISMSLTECQAECLRNYNCTAYANPCLMWLGYLLDTRDLFGANDNQNLYIRLPISELDLMEKKKKIPNKIIVVIAIASGVVLVALIWGIILQRKRQRRKAKKNEEDLELTREDNENLKLRLYKLETIVAATNNFSLENMLGEGGFGPVYKGNLSAREEIAIKRLSKTSGQGIAEFKNEVSLIAKLQHRNLVRLLGCCIEGNERMLIYEFLQNRSLDYFVFDQKRKAILTWPKRFDIIMGIARGLMYLHHDSRLKIIHRDLKTSNILLDEDLNPKISDFGLARIFDGDRTIVTTSRVVGTHGYMAPEYAMDGKYSRKSDIFSLGVVLLEIVSGKKNRGFEHDDHHHSLLGHAWLLWKEDKVLDLMDDYLNDSFIESQVKRCIQVGLLCVQRFVENRPVMSSVFFMLGTDGVILPDPEEPGFFIERSSNFLVSGGSTSTKSKISEKGTITITELVAR